MLTETQTPPFQLIAIVPLANCHEAFRKKLRPCTPYAFYNNFNIEVEEDGSGIKLFERCAGALLDDFYSESKDLNISISAMVGKNGSGKSTLIDLLFLSAYAQGRRMEEIESGKERVEHRIKEVINDQNLIQLAAPLKEGQSIPDLIERGYRNSDHLLSDVIGRHEFKRVPQKKIALSDRLNYVLLRLNLKMGALQKLLKREEKFETHFEEAFNLSVLFQKDGQLFEWKHQQGQIVLNEWLNGRTYKVCEDNWTAAELFYTIAVNYSQHSLNSDTDGHWLEGLFHKNDGYQTPVVINPMRHNGNYDINREDRFAQYRLLSNVVVAYLRKESLDGFLISSAQTIRGISFRENVAKVSDQMISRKVLKNKNSFAYCVLHSFVWKPLRLNFDKCAQQPFALEVLGYVVSKVRKMTETYGRYADIWHENTPAENESYQHIADSLYKAFIEDNSHVTFKLRQAIYFLKRNKLEPQRAVWKSVNSLDFTEIPIGELVKWIGVKQKATFLDIIKQLPPSIFDLDFVFEVNTKSDAKDLGENSFTRLSSGEKQLIHSVQTVMYHLGNLDSISPVEGRTELSYNHVNIIFDEIELYFHPDFQRSFVNYLLLNLRRLKLNRIRAINVLFATHSPFILSDIPTSNVLRLSGGDRPKIEKQQSFGANIHRLLADDFYMENGFMGEFARQKIEQALRNLKGSLPRREQPMKPEDVHDLIELIGEPFIQKKLLAMWEKKYADNNSIEQLLEKAKAEVKRLENLRGTNDSPSA